MSSRTTENCQAERSFHASFVVRCFVDASGKVHARLIDVATGVVYPLADLSELAACIGRLLRRNLRAASERCREV